MGDPVPGCHFTFFVGCTTDVTCGVCECVPTLGASEEASLRALGGSIGFISLSTSVDPRLGSALPEGSGRAQRTPDSAQILLQSPAAHDVSGAHSALTSIPYSAHSRRPAHDSGGRPSEASVPSSSFPTDQKEREKAKKKALKEAGVEVTVKKRFKVVEDHHDDCGENLSSLDDVSTTATFVDPYDFDTDEALSDEDHNAKLLSENVSAFPLDVSTVPRAAPGGTISFNI